MIAAAEGQPSKLRSFSNSTLQDNWYEDRIQAPEEVTHQERLDKSRAIASEDGICRFVGFENYSQPLATVPARTRHLLPGSTRTIPIDVNSLDYATTYLSMHKGQMAVQHPPATTKIIQQGNYYEEIHTSRLHPTLPSSGFGGVLPSHPRTHSETYFETTNQHFYDKKVEQHKAKPPATEQGDDVRFVGGYPASHNPNAMTKGHVYSDSKGFFYTRSLPRDSLDAAEREEPPRGKLGSRGELIKKPQESGSKLGTSTWADEYAQR